MPRSKRTVIDEAAEFGFSNYGTDWYDRGVAQSYTAEPIAPQDDYVTISLPAPIRLPDGMVVDSVTIWGRGLVTFGAPTAEQRAAMATLSGATDLSAFLEDFPGAYIDPGLQSDAYGDMEFGSGARDFVPNPFGVLRDPRDPEASGIVKFDHAQARGFAYVTWGGAPYEGSAEDYDWVENVPVGPGGMISVQFSDEGIRIGGGAGLLHFGDTDVAIGGDGFVYYSELNPASLTSEADVASVTAGPEHLMGLAGDDRLTGGAYADRLDGDDDNDVLVGGGGIDRLFGGDGDDDLSDGDEQGLLSGGAGNDMLRPGGGEDTIDGGDGIDGVVFDYAGWSGAIGFALDPTRTDYLLPGDLYKSITGVEAVTFTAGGGDDRLGGGTADDVLIGNGGQDTLLGGDGNDALSGGDARDYLEGGAGDDWLDGGSASGPLVVSAGPGYAVFDLDPNPSLLVKATEEQLYPDSAGWNADFYFSLTSTAQSLTFDVSSTDGNDVSFTLNVYDAEYREVYSDAGSAGSFTLPFENFGYDDGSGEWVAPAPGRYYMTISAYDDRPAELSFGLRLSGVPIPDGDTMVGGLGDDTYVVDSLYDRVFENSGAGRDTIVTALAAYSLAAFPDVERLVGDAGAQALTGNAADNTIVSGGGADTLDGGGGDDLLVIAGTPARVDGGTGTNTLAIAAGASVALDDGLVSGVDKVVVRAGATLDLSALDDSFAPLRALGGATIIGSDGADRVRSGGAADTLMGGAGDDVIVLIHQAASIDGGSESDTLSLAGEPGTAYAFDDATLAGVERIRVGAGNALDLTGLTEAPVLIRLSGGAQVTGSDAADHILGSANADVIAGGGGADRMTGGDGADRFVFNSLIDSPRGTGACDVITDFDGAEGDRIDLSALSDDGFAFLADGAFTGQGAGSAEIRLVVHGDRTVVQVDVDHDARADLSFVVRAADALTSADFIL